MCYEMSILDSDCCVSQQNEAYRIISFSRRRSLRVHFGALPTPMGRRSITFQTGLDGVLGKGGKGVEMAFDLNGCDEVGATRDR
jgi:hypothetical protein